ncbi:MAG: hypothetical protein KKC79_08500, partial [Gammaproteobacteria bacterium]|nr:hypothetical protein [Gammaproteobacteria bacterium]
AAAQRRPPMAQDGHGKLFVGHLGGVGFLGHAAIWWTAFWQEAGQSSAIKTRSLDADGVAADRLDRGRFDPLGLVHEAFSRWDR